jgi:sodium-dependent dicarboxylate transporter 2/3/5
MGKERNEKKVDFQLVKQPWTSDQLKVAAIFIFVVLLWIAKDLITPFLGFNYRDENVAILGGVLMFLLPSSKKDQSLLVWKDTEKLPWGILLLFGGGLALATIMEKNGLINSLAILFKQLEGTSYTPHYYYLL